MDALPELPEAQAQALRRRARREWALLAALAVLGAAVLAALQVRQSTALAERESRRLQAQARVLDLNLSRQFEGMAGGLRALGDELAGGGLPMPATEARLRTLQGAWPGVATLEWLDADGRVRASTRAGRAGSDGAARPVLRGLRSPTAVAGRLHLDDTGPGSPVDAPAGPPPHAWPLELAWAWPARDGRPAGALVATLDPAFFQVLLHSVLYADDMWAAVARGDGLLLMYDPPRPAARGLDLAQPGSMFSRHRDRGQVATVSSGRTLVDEGERLIAQHTLQRAAAALAQPLVLAVSRDRDAALESARREAALVSAFAALGLLSAAALLARVQAARGRQARREAAVRQRADADAEFLQLALQGADLALWDADVPSGQGRVNDRWFTMLGLQRGEIGSDSKAWAALLHPEDRERVLAEHQAHIDGRTPAFESRYRLRHKQGHWVWVLDRGRVVARDAAGRARRMAGTHLDISEQVRTEQALREGEARSHALLAALRAGVVVHGSDTQVLEANPAASRLLGLTLEQMRGREAVDPAWRFVDEDGQPMPVSNYPVMRVRATLAPLDAQVVGIVRPDRPATTWVLCSAYPVLGASGGLQQVVVTFVDITERQTARAALEASEARLRGASRLARIGAWSFEIDGDCWRIDATLAGWLGRDAAQPLRSAEAMAVVDEADRWRWRRRVDEAMSSGGAFDEELAVKAAGGRTLLLRVFAEVVRDGGGRISGLHGAAQDVTESRRAQQQLRLLEASVERLNDAVMITEAGPLADPGPRIVFVNPALERLTGRTASELIGRSPRLFQGPQTDRAELARIGRALRRGEPVRAELVNQRPDGEAYWVELAIAPVHDGAGRVTHHVAVERDISARKAAEQRLRAAQAELAATLDAVPDLLFDCDLDGVIHGHHSPRSDLLLHPAEAFLGRRFDELLPPEAAAAVRDAIAQAHATGRSGGQQYRLDLPDGAHWFELSVSRKPVADGALPRFVMLARDVSERRRAEDERRELERQLREAQKMESIGTLAGGIAHDFNNILAAILGNAAMAGQDLAALGELPAARSARAGLEQIHRAAVRARTLVQQILTFSRRQPAARSVLPLRPVVEETLALLRSTLPAGVRLQAQLAEAPLLVRADATQLQQVLMNLCTNAWQALGGAPGDVTVALVREPGGAPPGRHWGELPAGPRARLTVGDSGAGMDEATLSRIFDPFFTTKPVGQGTGLGLAVVLGIVQEHQGAIAVDTRPGGGSRFHVLLPLASTGDAGLPLAGPAGDGAAASTLQDGAGRQVLYVDDDEVMVLMVQRLLRRAGWRVTACDSARDALQRFEAAPEAFDAVITDFNMPGLSGLDLARELLRRRPGLPVLITSGLVPDELQAAAAAAGVRGVLQKERTLEELGPLLRQTVGTAAAG